MIKMNCSMNDVWGDLRDSIWNDLIKSASLNVAWRMERTILMSDDQLSADYHIMHNIVLEWSYLYD